MRNFFVSAFFLCAAVDFVTGSLGYFFPGESDFVFSGIFDGSQCRFGRCIFFPECRLLCGFLTLCFFLFCPVTLCFFLRILCKYIIA